MSFIPCEICRYPKSAQERTCPRCVAVGVQQLKELLVLQRLASEHLEPRRGGMGSFLRSFVTGYVPCDLDALDFSQGQDLLDVLLAWKEWVWDELNLEVELGEFHRPLASASNALPNIVNFVLVHFQDIVSNDEWRPLFLDEIRKLHQIGLRVTGQTETKRTRLECPGEFNEKPCKANLEVDISDFDTTIYCRKCRTLWNLDRLLLVGRSTPDSKWWLDVPDIAHHKRITLRKARYWIKKWHISRHPKGAYYDFNEFSEKFDAQILNPNDERK